MADGRHLEKSKMRHISAVDWPILMKFGRLTQIGPTKRISRQKFEFLKTQDLSLIHISEPTRPY